MSSIPNLQQEYQIKYYPPKSKKNTTNLSVITMTALFLCATAVPAFFMYVVPINLIVALSIGPVIALIFILVMRPRLIKKGSKKMTITIDRSTVRVEPENELQAIYPIRECSFSYYDDYDGDDVRVAGIEITLRSGTQLHIRRKYALEGDFEALLKELKSQFG